MSSIVYIADSDTTVSESIRFLLASDNISARVFSQGQKLLSCALTTPPGCIVTDALLPDMPALRLLQQLHNEGLEIPMIILSADEDIQAVVEAVRTGAWDYFEKPVLERVLLKSVRRAMNAKPTPSGPQPRPAWPGGH